MKPARAVNAHPGKEVQTMNQAIRARIRSVLLIAVLLAILVGCSAIGGGKQPDATLTALSTAVAGTATAAKQNASGENSLATVQAEATAKSVSILMTQTASRSNLSESQRAEATLSAPIIAELPQYGLDSAGGHVGWVNDPLTLEITGYQQITYGNDHPEVTAADFVLAANILWDTQYGSSGCGVMFRSNGDKKKPDAYMVLASRFANGRVIFTALADGEIANVHIFYPKDKDRSFQWQNGTSNRLTVIARGNLIEIYTNGVKIGEVDTTKPPDPLPSPSKPLPPLDTSNTQAMNGYRSQLKEYEDIVKRSESMYQTALKNYMNRKSVFEDGFLTMVAASESGRTVCKFEKAWLWLIESK